MISILLLKDSSQFVFFYFLMVKKYYLISGLITTFIKYYIVENIKHTADFIGE